MKLHINKQQFIAIKTLISWKIKFIPKYLTQKLKIKAVMAIHGCQVDYI